MLVLALKARHTQGALVCAKAVQVRSASRAVVAVSRETGTLLYMLARSVAARSMVEFGTSFGISTLHLAAALRDNGGGRRITTEFEPGKVARARANLAAGGLLELSMRLG